jgi:hypothetical protein
LRPEAPTSDEFPKRAKGGGWSLVRDGVALLLHSPYKFLGAYRSTGGACL